MNGDITRFEIVGRRLYLRGMRRQPERIAGILQQRYRAAAHSGDWSTCLKVAGELATIGLRDAAAADVVYAEGYAHEQLGEIDRARACHGTVLMMQRGHEKARRRLAGLR